MTGAEFSGVDIDLLADYIGGALEGTPDESAVATLIAEDPAWREAFETLGGQISSVRAELGRLEAEPMPADVAARLDGLFSAPPLTLVKGDPGAPTATSTVSGRRRKWVTPIAIAAGFIAFVGFGVDYLSGRTASQTDTASTAADGSAESAISMAGETILVTGTDYTRATLAITPAQPLAAAPSSGDTSAFGESDAHRQDRATAQEPALVRLSARAALEECFRMIERDNAGGVISVQTVDYARFEGAPALIVRFSANNGAWAWAVGPGCGTPMSGADAIDKVPVR
ncbi:hypothetical protein [Actinoplanes solisilvae]|uniref:hypothetical protein n=1 Tax=Actinoplanes solisilvae TaxID=2486853 RepID=UPI000FD9CB81|nr:hypothetical protein [Actinoplanes solisilvae]